ncbi:MAG: Gfo/Idh/MocA family oxidoreductase [Armatimonadota bacterium]|nr:Gfo/Idh/MocA family oxidoreductase [Armatimonadota bacterium]
MSDSKIGRREFLVKSASGIAGLALGTMLADSRAIGANDRLSIGVIGAGGKGRDNMAQAMRYSDELNLEITAVCDVWKVNLESAVAAVEKQYGRKPRAFTGYEDLLALDDVDAVLIATPDHLHCRMLIDAMKAGKDVFVEKPMAMFLDQANESLRVQKETGRVVQVGTQRRSDGRHAAAARFIRSGALGKISRVEAAWNDCAPRWRKGDVSNCKPEDVDWKRFLMCAKKRPFNASRFREWQLYRDYTLGPVGLLGSHMIDVVHWFMDDYLPTSCVCHGGNYVWKDGREHEDTIYALFEYPKGFILRYCTGLGNTSGNGCYFYGTNGTFDTVTWKATGDGGSGKDKIKEEIVIQTSGGVNHMKNFLECIRSRQTPNASIFHGYAHSVCAIMAARSLRTGKRVTFDPKEQKIYET